MRFVGAVLTGGASRRMGRDKASLPIDGVAMAVRVAAALRDAGAADVVLVGLAVEGEAWVADDHPGEGPLGGILTARRWAGDDAIVVVAPCDLVAPDPAAFAALVDALGAATVAVAGPDDPLPLALAPGAAAPVLQAAFAAGERSLRRALVALEPVIAGLPAEAVQGANTTAELPPGAG